MNNEENKGSLDFYGLGIAPKLLKIIEQLNFSVPTPIQLKSIPVTIEGKDIVGIAQTGTGKTLAFGIPMLQRLAQHSGRGLVLLPTRELALQVDEHLRMIGQKLGLRTAVLIGGEPINKQTFALRRNPHIIIATPGRLLDHMKNMRLSLKEIKILVLDEADLMFDMGFAPQIESVLAEVPKERQTMLFSATMPPAIMNIVNKHMALPIRIEVAPAGTPAENVSQEMIVIKNEDKMKQVEKILSEYPGSILIFSRTKYGARNLCHKLNSMGQRTAEIHSNRTLFQRKEALGGFKNGKYRILVATDIAARGIDVSGIELVLNYDLPDNSEDYVHRIGRTGRAGKTGRAISFVLPSQMKDVKNIERLIKKNIKVNKDSVDFIAEPKSNRFAKKRHITSYHSPERKPFDPKRSRFPEKKRAAFPDKRPSSFPGKRQSTGPARSREDSGQTRVKTDKQKFRESIRRQRY